MENKKLYHQLLAAKIIKGLKQRNMEGYYFENTDDATAKINELITKNQTVSFGGSMTLRESGILDSIRNRDDITLLDRDQCTSQEETDEIMRKSFFADTYLLSTNAITEDGQLVNIDGNGNRVAALIYGPKQVIVVAGLNKVTPTVDAAMLRARSYAAPINNIRLDKPNPCTKTGDCHNCFSDSCICNQFVVTRRSGTPGRIQVILLEGEYGY